MKPVEIVRAALATQLTDDDGNDVSLELLPPLTQAEIDAFAGTLPCPLPADIRELLAMCRGLEGGAPDFLAFTGDPEALGLEEIFPHGLTIAGDGFGNFWVVDLVPESSTYGPIYFACHDPPVILYQSPDLAQFLVELFKCSQPPHESLVNDVHEDRLFNVWGTNPGVRTQAECAASEDADLRAFAATLDPSFEIVDLRGAKVGFGFSWGRYGPGTLVRRFGSLPLFAYQKPEKKPGLLKRLFG